MAAWLLRPLDRYCLPMHSARSQRTYPKSLFRLLGIILITTWTRLASAEPPSEPPGDASTRGRPSVCDNLVRELSGYKVPGRNPDSRMPWEFFMGNASHQLIAYIYGTRHPTAKIYYNNQSIKDILTKEGLGDWSLLTKDNQTLRPDITDMDIRQVFEIKPANPAGLQRGIKQLETYLLAFKQTLDSTNQFSAGIRFEGEVLIQFAQGQYIWRLEWCTHTHGVTQYLWTRSRQRLDSGEAAYVADQWVELSEQELKQYGGWVGGVVEGMVDRRERLATLSGAVGVAIDMLGEVAIIILSLPNPSEQSSTQPAGKVLPFPSRNPSPGTSVQFPKASGL